MLDENPDIFGDKTENVWKLFEELENKVRIATSYGKRENGEMKVRASKILESLEKLCGDFLVVAKRV